MVPPLSLSECQRTISSPRALGCLLDRRLLHRQALALLDTRT
jgi:hypothetical protein